MNDANLKKNQENKIRALKRNALKGNISSLFELMGGYEAGTDIPIDLKLSDEYFKKCVDALGFDLNSEIEVPRKKLNLILFYWLISESSAKLILISITKSLFLLEIMGPVKQHCWMPLVVPSHILTPG